MAWTWAVTVHSVHPAWELVVAVAAGVAVDG